jgi:hypothetical protein
MGDIIIDGVEIPTIDVGDVDPRPLGLTITGFSVDAVVSVALTRAGVPPVDADWHEVAWTDETNTAVELPLGTDFDIATIGPAAVYPRIKVTDGTTIATASGAVPLIITEIGESTI